MKIFSKQEHVTPRYTKIFEDIKGCRHTWYMLRHYAESFSYFVYFFVRFYFWESCERRKKHGVFLMLSWRYLKKYSRSPLRNSWTRKWYSPCCSLNWKIGLTQNRGFCRCFFFAFFRFLLLLMIRSKESISIISSLLSSHEFICSILLHVLHSCRRFSRK